MIFERVVHQFEAMITCLRNFLLFVVLFFTSEWLFLSTKLSFLSGNTFIEKFGLLCSALFLLLLLITLVAFLVGLVLETLVAYGAFLFRFVILLFTAFFQTFLALMLLDNFFYTVFGIGLKVLSTGERRLVGFLVVLVFMLLVYLQRRFVSKSPLFYLTAGKRNKLYGSMALITLLLSGLLVQRIPAPEVLTTRENGLPESRPNIVIISSDALEAEHMSVYGYGSNTTPFLLARKHEFLLAENSFTNSSVTLGSIGSLLTGKYPTTTELFYYPDVLLDKDQYQHLPGLLRDQGYRLLDMSVRWYADPRDMNMRHAFHEANFRTIYSCAGGLGIDLLCAKFPKTILLVEQIFDRMLEKIELLIQFRDMPTEADEMQAGQRLDRDLVHWDNTRILRVGQPQHYYHRDEARVEQATGFIDRSDTRPFFIHLHMMGTHGPAYTSTEVVFSAGLRQTVQWQREFYDDSILRLDKNIRTIYTHLNRKGLLDETILVITSDHGTDWRIDSRLPLMFRFPETRYAGKIVANTQRIDVAPTLLNFMGLEKPEWMEGRSLLKQIDDPSIAPPVFSTRPAATITQSGDHWVQHQPTPPFYSLGGLGVIICDQVFTWSFGSNTMNQSVVEGHTRPCEESEIPGRNTFQSLIKQHLASRDYDVRSLITTDKQHGDFETQQEASN